MANAIKFIDLFCGVGGIRLGMEKQGFECVFSCDINSECQRTYYENFGEKPEGDIKLIDETKIPKHDILCAGFPCQPFSISGKQKGFDDTRGTLFFEICRVISFCKPRVVFLENVKHLVHHDHGNTLGVITSSLEKLGYKVSYKVLNASDFGVPQNRERIIIIGYSKSKFDFEKVRKTPRRKLIEFLDSCGDFEYLEPSEYTLLDTTKEQPGSGLIFAGYRNKLIRKVGVRPGTEHLSRVHKQPNRIYSVYGIHPTLPSQESSGRYFILTDENRVRKLTLDECWRIMGFPEDYKKVSSAGEQYKQLGNSVCVPMIAAVASEIQNQFWEDDKMSHSDVLNEVYSEALEKTANDNLSTGLDNAIINDLELLISRSERNKGLVTVLITLTTHKIVSPSQDIRYHQAQLPNGFAGRGIDQQYITPFMKSVSFPAMAESGWLTRSLEQPHPYDFDYPGKIKPDNIKRAFLTIVDKVQKCEAQPREVLDYIFRLLIKQRDTLNIELAKPHSLSISSNMDSADWDSIDNEIKRISQIHGCQVIVNGVYTTLKYYLRLVKDPAEFIDRYVELLKSDETVKFQHKEVWNDIISGNI